MSDIDNLSAKLGRGTYHWNGEDWMYRGENDHHWSRSVPLEASDVDEGVRIIAACPWASMIEDGVASSSPEEGQ